MKASQIIYVAKKRTLNWIRVLELWRMTYVTQKGSAFHFEYDGSFVAYCDAAKPLSHVASWSREPAEDLDAATEVAIGVLDAWLAQ